MPSSLRSNTHSRPAGRSAVSTAFIGVTNAGLTSGRRATGGRGRCARRSPEPDGRLAHEPLGLVGAQPPAADQVHGGRADLGHDHADREVRGLLEHERRLGGGTERRLAHHGRPAGSSRIVERAHGCGKVSQRVRYRRRDVVADGERDHRPAAQRLDAGQRRADLGRGLLVARELQARAAAERRQVQHLPPRGDGAVELGEAQAVQRAQARSARSRSRALQRAGDVLERPGDLAEQRRGGAVHGLHGVARQQRGDGDRDDAAEQRVEEARARQTGPGQLDRHHEQRRRGRLADEHGAAAERDRDDHRAATPPRRSAAGPSRSTRPAHLRSRCPARRRSPSPQPSAGAAPATR